MRTYKRRPTYRRDRRDRAAQMRARGLSLREIAAKLRVSHETIRRDLAAWDAQQARVSHLPVTKVTPARGEKCDTGCDTAATVTPIRRKTS